jgi:CheY-like chemotaxis protein
LAPYGHRHVDLASSQASNEGGPACGSDESRQDALYPDVEAGMSHGRVLVLDDDPWHVSWIGDLAEALQYECEFVSTFEEAKTAFELAVPNIAVVDIRIGDVDAPLVGATLQAVDPQWVGLRFLRFCARRPCRQQDAAVCVHGARPGGAAEGGRRQLPGEVFHEIRPIAPAKGSSRRAKAYGKGVIARAA